MGFTELLPDVEKDTTDCHEPEAARMLDRGDSPFSCDYFPALPAHVHSNGKPLAIRPEPRWLRVIARTAPVPREAAKRWNPMSTVVWDCRRSESVSHQGPVAPQRTVNP